MSESASTAVTTEKLEQMLAKVRKLLDAAEATERTAEREGDPEAAEGYRKSAANYRETAERIRRQYKIEEEQLIADDASVITPVVRDIVLCSYDSDFIVEFLRMWGVSAHHTGVLYQPKWVGRDMAVRAVGYASDIRSAEDLFQVARLVMADRLDPQVDPKLSDKENVYRLRSAGMERNRIANLLWGASLGAPGHKDHARVGKLYSEACRERGEAAVVAGKGINKKVFRAKYAESFSYRYAERLRATRDAVDSVAGALVLPGREKRVEEMFYAEFPELHPDARRAAAERYRAEEASQPQKPKKERRWTRADQERYERENFSAAARAGQQAGRDAADRIEMSRTSKAAQRLEPEPSPNGRGIELGN